MDFWQALVERLKREAEEIAKDTGHGKIAAEITIRRGRPTAKRVIRETTEQNDN